MNSLKTFITWWLANGSTATDAECSANLSALTDDDKARLQDLVNRLYR